MFTAYPPGADPILWYDLVEPTDEEAQEVQRRSGLRVPTLAQLSEVESSSRLVAEGEVLTLSSPGVFRAEGAQATVSPVGFVVSPSCMITLRYAPLVAFEGFAHRFATPDSAPHSSLEAFVCLLETIVDRLADVLEGIGAKLDGISSDVFAPEEGRRAGALDRELRDALRFVGRLGDHVSKTRDSLQGIARIVPFALSKNRTRLTPDLIERFETLGRDVASLRDYDEHLSTKTQFLLDATLGLIGIQQNGIVKTLTIASVVGIPPTLVAGIYGMNFKSMPEYDWAWGYAYGWAVLILSAVIPLIWLRIRGWI